MGGDGMGGLAIAILFASVLLFTAPAAILFFIAMALAKKNKYRVPIAIASATFGTAIGFVAVAATFFESSFSPSNRLVLHLSPDLKHEWVVLLEKPGATESLKWRGANLPFLSKTAEIKMPLSGVVIVDSLEHAGGGFAQAYNVKDELFPGQSGGPAPQGSGYTTYLAFLRPDLSTNPAYVHPEPQSLNDATEFASFLRERGLNK
jgi:hypothetical protein